MARVFLAEETRLGRKVVLKVLSTELAGGISAERFEREIRLAARLQHPNIVPLLAAGDVGGLPYYTMPFVEGPSLRVRLEEGPLPLDEAIAILRDVARALAHAHRNGVVHRDIKPENVLLSEDAALVSDFGVARADRVRLRPRLVRRRQHVYPRPRDRPRRRRHSHSRGSLPRGVEQRRRASRGSRHPAHAPGHGGRAVIDVGALHVRHDTLAAPALRRRAGSLA
jgi:serine/threonine protein kinase